jgi:hypothetical protein
MLANAAECERLLPKDKEVLGGYPDEGYRSPKWSSPDRAESLGPIIRGKRPRSKITTNEEGITLLGC